MARVSVVIPVYNVKKYICPCIDSIRRQTLKDIEIICVDDGSTDGCSEILDEYAKKDNRIKVIHKPNSGYGHSMNVGMDAATGEYFAIVESDDVIEPNMYQKLYAVAENYDLDVIKADFYRFVEVDNKMDRTRFNIAGSGMYNRVIDADQEKGLVLKNSAVYTWSGIYKRKFLYENNIRHNETPGASYQDNGFWFQTMSMAQKIYFYKEPFYCLRRDNPNSSIYNKSKVYCIRDEYEFILKYIQERPDIYDKVIPYYWKARFGAYEFSYNRIADEFKSEFLDHFIEVMKTAKERNELKREAFRNNEWREVQTLVKGKEEYEKVVRKLADRANEPATALNRLKWCYEDNGMAYTVMHTLKRAGKVVRKKVFGDSKIVGSSISRNDYYELLDEVHGTTRDIIVKMFADKEQKGEGNA